MAPTRELALQVSGDLAPGRPATAACGCSPSTAASATSPSSTRSQSGVDIVVGTPGRLLDLANRRALDLSHVHALVLDEADEMLDLGFLPDVERLLRQTPETRQTMLFSATMPAAIVALARTHMRHPMNIRAESSYENATVPATAQFIYQAHDLDKPEIIGRILQAEDADKMIVFTRTKRQAQRIAEDLAERGFKASPLHGDMAQVAREKALAKFREDKIKVLVATDVAARGIDVSGVTHVVNYTCPEDDKTYIHRIGRTGRAGASGIAITLVDCGGHAPLEDDQQGARPAVRRADRDLLDLGAPLPRPGHPAGHQGPDRSPGPRASASRARSATGPRGPRTATATAPVPAAASPPGARPVRRRRRRAWRPSPLRAPATAPPAAATATGVGVGAAQAGLAGLPSPPRRPRPEKTIRSSSSPSR